MVYGWGSLFRMLMDVKMKEEEKDGRRHGFIFVLCCCVGRSEVLVCFEGSRTPGSCDRAGHPLAAKLKWQESRNEHINNDGSRSVIDSMTAKNVSCL
jgi:hypothetical protein